MASAHSMMFLCRIVNHCYTEEIASQPAWMRADGTGVMRSPGGRSSAHRARRAADRLAMGEALASAGVGRGGSAPRRRFAGPRGRPRPHRATMPALGAHHAWLCAPCRVTKEDPVADARLTDPRMANLARLKPAEGPPVPGDLVRLPLLRKALIYQLGGPKRHRRSPAASTVGAWPLAIWWTTTPRVKPASGMSCIRPTSRRCACCFRPSWPPGPRPGPG
jgi:hypothetical protein